MKERIILIFLSVSTLVFIAFAQQTCYSNKKNLVAGFINPPIISKPNVLWPWVNGNLSLSQITLEMEQARLKGMGGFDIWDVGTTVDADKIVPDGPPFVSDASLTAYLAMGVVGALRLTNINHKGDIFIIQIHGCFLK
ncbi:MAG: hypothetical protein ABIN89_28340 [Chitinophagaceae bacterium]